MGFDDFDLTEHFSFYEFTGTANKELLEKNRAAGLLFVNSLKEVAMLLERLRAKVGALRVHSGFRSSELNNATPGSSSKSQHQLGEAVDFSGASSPATEYYVDSLFEKVLTTIIEEGIPFGQLIRETAQRSYGSADWLHISLGTPYRPAEKCGQVLRMVNGKYTHVKTIPIGR